MKASLRRIASLSFRSILVLSLYLTIGLALFSSLRPSIGVFLPTTARTINIQVYPYEEGYSEQSSRFINQSSLIRTPHGFEHGIFISHVPSTRLRLDPLNNEPYTFTSFILIFKTLLYEKQVVVDRASLKYTLHQLRFSRESGTISDYNGEDPFIELLLDQSNSHIEESNFSVAAPVCCFLGLAFVLTSLSGIARLMCTRDVATFFTLIACFFAFLLHFSLLAPLNHGPDEQMHLFSYPWYLYHIRPPLMSLHDTDYRHPLWQTSYVFAVSGDLTYLITARIAQLVSLFASIDYLTWRVIQTLFIFLFGGVITFCFGTSWAVGYFIPWLVIPQLAYTATYLNGDAISFSLAFVASALLYSRRAIPSYVRLPLALFLLLNCKSNYIAAIPALIAPWGISLFSDKRKELYQASLVTLLFSPILFYRRIFNYLDQYMAGRSYNEELLHRVNEIERTPELAPYLDIVRTTYEKGVHGSSRWDVTILWDYNWYTTSWRSFIGVFGNMSDPIPTLFYYIGTACVLAILLASCRSLKYIAYSGLTICLTISASLYYSISAGYQAQGRYLFPILPVIVTYALPRLRRYKSLFIPGAFSTLAAMSWYLITRN